MNWNIYDQNGKLINRIYSDESFVIKYCSINNYTYQKIESENQLIQEPTQLDKIEAQVAYTAMMTNTLLEE